MGDWDDVLKKTDKIKKDSEHYKTYVKLTDGNRAPTTICPSVESVDELLTNVGKQLGIKS